MHQLCWARVRQNSLAPLLMFFQASAYLFRKFLKCPSAHLAIRRSIAQLMPPPLLLQLKSRQLLQQLQRAFRMLSNQNVYYRQFSFQHLCHLTLRQRSEMRFCPNAARCVDHSIDFFKRYWILFLCVWWENGYTYLCCQIGRILRENITLLATCNIEPSNKALQYASDFFMSHQVCMFLCDWRIMFAL